MPYNDMFMSNLTLLFNSSGAGVQVSCSHGMIHLKYSAPPIMIVNNIHTLIHIFFAINFQYTSTKQKDFSATGIMTRQMSLGFPMEISYQ